LKVEGSWLKPFRTSLQGAGIKFKFRKNFMRRGNLMLWIFFYHEDTRRKKAAQRKYKGIEFKVDG